MYIYKGNKDDNICPQKYAPNLSSNGHISKFPSPSILPLKTKKSKGNGTKIVKYMPLNRFIRRANFKVFLALEGAHLPQTSPP